MRASKEELLARRRELIARSDAYREDIARSVEVWRGPLDTVDRVRGIVRDIGQKAPWLASLAGAVWMVARGRGKRGRGFKAPGIFGTAQLAWSVAQGILGVASTFRRRSGRT
ncbi:MAG TPA: YqjK family protein [Candidatus Eisenbacteria bacterium]|nr:YqjK family protein [Candidatus Eisenbacteria bacterium]